MPQALEGLRAEWGIDPQKAMDHLKDAGYRLTHEWTWIKPKNKEFTAEDNRAALFLALEWDFGFVEDE